MIDDFVGKLSGNAGYKPDADLLEAVQKKTSELSSEDYLRGRIFCQSTKLSGCDQRIICQRKRLAGSLGFVLAMSRSQFNLQSDAAAKDCGECRIHLLKKIVIINCAEK